MRNSENIGHIILETVRKLMHIVMLLDQRKYWSIFLLFFIITILGWFLNLFRAFATLSLVSYYEISIIIVISRYFQVWNYINKKLIKNFCYSLIFWNHIFRNYLLLSFSGVILDFISALSVNKGFTVFQNVFIPVMHHVLI